PPYTHRYAPSFPTRRSSDLFGSGLGDGSAGCRTRIFPGRQREFQFERALETVRFVRVGIARRLQGVVGTAPQEILGRRHEFLDVDRKSTRLNSSHLVISYAV